MIFQKIIDQLSKKIENYGEYILLDNSNTVKIDKNKFYSIPDSMAINKIAYIDGGNAEIIGAANFSLQLIRVYYAVYLGSERIKHEKQEFYVLISANYKEKKLFYSAEAFNTNLRVDEEFDAFDSKLSEAGHKAEPGKIAEAIRKIAELKIAAEIAGGLDEGDMIVRDGDLTEGTDQEQWMLKELKEKANEKGVIVAGISKTTGILTDSGNSAAAVLNNIGPDCEWYYPASKEIGFAKLHKASNYVFRVDIFNPAEIKKILGLLKRNSKDACFAGYPYGLIEADRYARISHKEQEQIRMMFAAKGGSRFRRYISSKDAHELLNKVI